MLANASHPERPRSRYRICSNKTLWWLIVSLAVPCIHSFVPYSVKHSDHVRHSTVYQHTAVGAPQASPALCSYILICSWAHMAVLWSGCIAPAYLLRKICWWHSGVVHIMGSHCDPIFGPLFGTLHLIYWSFAFYKWIHFHSIYLTFNIMTCVSHFVIHIVTQFWTPFWNITFDLLEFCIL